MNAECKENDWIYMHNVSIISLQITNTANTKMPMIYSIFLILI